MNKRIFLTGATLAMLAAFSAQSAEAPKRKFGNAPKVSLSGIDENNTFGRFIVTYKEGASARNNAATIAKNASSALVRAGLSSKSGSASAQYVRKLATGSDLIRTTRKLDRVEAEAFIRQIAADPAVASVRVDALRRATRDVAAPSGLKKAAAYVPSDPYFDTDQWHLKAPDGTVNYDGGSNYGGINAPEAWDLADGNGIVIAVLDTGITAHPDVDTSLADAGYDFISDSYVSGRDTDDRVAGGWDQGDWTHEDPWLSDSQCVNATNPASESSWHGTHVAATAGAELTDNGIGEAGVAHGAKILPVRVLGHCGGYDSDINDGIVWAAGGHVDGVPDNANPAQVINLSLGGSGTCAADDPAAEAIALANSLGATVVVSAGNSGANAANYSPASCPGAITVAANGVTSRRAYYSNYGSVVDISAPGGGVYANDGSSGTAIYDGFVWQALNPGATTPTPLAEISDTTAYGGYAGTSQAAPHVSGVIALLQGARLDADLPLLTPTEVLALLKQTVTPFTVTPSTSQPIGAGIVNAPAAVAAAIEPPCTEDCGPVATALANKTPVTGLTGGELLYSFEASAGSVLSILTSGGTGNVSLYVASGEEPTAESYDFASTRTGNSETVRVTAPQAGTYYIKLTGTFSGVTLQARQ